MVTPSYVALPLPPRLFDPASIFYTDASQADPASGTGPVGVGIHYPKLGVSRHFVASDQPRTVQRGELAGIWWAVLNAPPNDPLHIASDSLTSSQQLHFRQPIPPRFCRHFLHPWRGHQGAHSLKQSISRRPPWRARGELPAAPFLAQIPFFPL